MHWRLCACPGGVRESTEKNGQSRFSSGTVLSASQAFDIRQQLLLFFLDLGQSLLVFLDIEKEQKRLADIEKKVLTDSEKKRKAERDQIEASVYQAEWEAFLFDPTSRSCPFSISASRFCSILASMEKELKRLPDIEKKRLTDQIEACVYQAEWEACEADRKVPLENRLTD